MKKARRLEGLTGFPEHRIWATKRNTRRKRSGHQKLVGPTP
jgi:hypothetical protein